MHDEKLSPLTPDELAAIAVELAEYSKPPEVRPICSQMELRPSGTKLVEPFFNLGLREDSCAVSLSVYSLTFIPDRLEDLNLLHRHVIAAVKALADIDPEFKSHFGHMASNGLAYERPHRQGEDKFVHNAYVYPDEGHVIVSVPMILTDAIHVYDRLKGVIIPSIQIAQQFEYARWMEIRGPLLVLDDRFHWSETSYTNSAAHPRDQLGCLANADNKTLIVNALKHAVNMHIAGVSTDEELVGHVVGLAQLTTTGLLTDGSGKYPALPAPGAGQTLQQNRQRQTKEIGARAASMMQDMLELAGESPGALPVAAFQRAKEALGTKLEATMAEDNKRYQQEAATAARKRKEQKRPSAFDRNARESLEVAEFLSDIISGKKHTPRGNDPGTFLAIPSNVGFASPDIPFFLPRRYTREGYYGDVATYTSRPAGPAYPPIVPLPTDLEPFIDREKPNHPAPQILHQPLPPPAS